MFAAVNMLYEVSAVVDVEVTFWRAVALFL